MGNSANERPIDGPSLFRADSPVTDERFDRFERAPFADRIADTIGRRVDPSSLVIAIYAPWGDGKTTVLNFIRNRLQTYPSVITVAFNPWRLDGEEALLQGFFITLADALNEHLHTTTEKVGDVLKKYGSLLKVAPGGWGDAAVGAGTALSSASIDQLKERISALLRDANRRVVVLMDDIDRLNKAEIQGILRLVKLTGDFENTAYVLAFDEQMVATAIGEKYAISSGKLYEAGSSFLEKIVQVPLHLPPAAPDALRRYCFELVDDAVKESGTEITQDQMDEFVSNFIEGLEVRLRTPRMAKRYANALHFSLAILRAETYPPDLMLIEGMRIFFPELYDAIRRNPDFVLQAQPRERATVGLEEFAREHTSGMTEKERRSAIQMVQTLFPRTGTQTFGRDWDTHFAREQRIASEYYFQRYFTYGVSRSDISDVQFIEFVSSLGGKKADEASAVLAGLIKAENAEKLIFKMRTLEDGIEGIATTNLAIAVARNASKLPNPPSFGPFQTPLKQAAILISKLVARVPAELRGEVALEIVTRAETLKFACECVRRLRTYPDSTREAVLSPQEEKAMGGVLAARIEMDLNSLPEPVFVSDRENSATYLTNWEWGAGDAAPRDYVSRQIANRPQSIFDLMKSFLGDTWNMASGRRIESDFDRSTYDIMCKVIDPTVAARILMGIFGEKMKVSQYDLPENEPRELRIANQFMFIFKNVSRGDPQGPEVPLA
jgi:KAP family P-loop domain